MVFLAQAAGSLAVIGFTYSILWKYCGCGGKMPPCSSITTVKVSRSSFSTYPAD